MKFIERSPDPRATGEKEEKEGERGREREREKVGFWDGQAGFSSGGTIRCRINQRNTPSIELASRWFTIERDRRTLNSESNEKKRMKGSFTISHFLARNVCD